MKSLQSSITQFQFHKNEEFSNLPPNVNVSMPNFIPKKEIKKNSAVELENSLHYLPHWRRESSQQRNQTLQLENCWMNPMSLTHSKLDINIYAMLPDLMKNKYGRVEGMLISNV